MENTEFNPKKAPKSIKKFLELKPRDVPKDRRKFFKEVRKPMKRLIYNLYPYLKKK
jgi:hypothetical protein